MLLNQLAHNLVVWMQQLIEQVQPRFAGWGILRMVRDVFGVAGRVRPPRKPGKPWRITLNRDDPLARPLALALSRILKEVHVVVNWGQI